MTALQKAEDRRRPEAGCSSFAWHGWVEGALRAHGAAPANRKKKCVLESGGRDAVSAEKPTCRASHPLRTHRRPDCRTV